MYCILVTGIPASGKTTFAEYISEQLHIPMISKDQIKEIMFDELGFKSREEKVKLGVASMEIMYYMAGQLMKRGQTFILENNFENSSKEGMDKLLKKYDYKAVTVTLTGNYKKIYERFLARDGSTDRHPGHVVNDYYPRELKPEDKTSMTYAQYVDKVISRGMDTFSVEGPHVLVDTSDIEQLNLENVVRQIQNMLKI